MMSTSNYLPWNLPGNVTKSTFTNISIRYLVPTIMDIKHTTKH